MKRVVTGWALMLFAVCLLTGSACAQAPASHSCTVDHTAPTPADDALAHAQYDQAETLYTAMPPSSAALGSGDTHFYRVEW